MAEHCWVCGQTDGLATRPLVAWSNEQALKTEVATCFTCRAKLYQSNDDRAIALSPNSPRAIRWRAVDVTAALSLVAFGLLWSGRVGWLNEYGFAAGLLLLVAAPFAGWRHLHRARNAEAGRTAAWEASEQNALRSDLELRWRAAWEDLCKHLDTKGLTTDVVTDGEHRVSLDIDRLLDPDSWRASTTATYVVLNKEGAHERTL